MREYLFRGKTFNDNAWIEGYIAINPSEPYDEGTYIADYKDPYDWYCITPKTLGQFTGLLDKNGKKIFEGDIVKAMMDYGPAGMLETVAHIIWNSDVGGWQWNYFDKSTIEVIGNIHDNPELLKGV